MNDIHLLRLRFFDTSGSIGTKRTKEPKVRLVYADAIFF